MPRKITEVIKDLPQNGQAAAEMAVRIDRVEVILAEDFGELKDVVVQLRTRDWDIDHGRQFFVGLIVVEVKGLLQPFDTERFERPGHL